MRVVCAIFGKASGAGRLRVKALALVAAVALGVGGISAGCAATDPPLPISPLPLGADAAVAAQGDANAIAISVAEVPTNLPKYDRGDWRHWVDADGDCQDARQETLIAESQGAVEYERADGCRVASGDWLGAYTGERFSNPRELDIDHMVPLANAHRSGAWQWDKARKREYANYLERGNHLIAVKASANRGKSDKGPEDWQPPRQEYHCQYAADWVDIKRRWGLTATPSEAEALRDMLAGCDTPVGLEITQAEGLTLPDATAPTQAPAGAGQAPAGAGGADSGTGADGDGLLYDPRGPDRDCGDFETQAQAQAFFEAAGGPGTDRHRLDGDGDGVACASLR